VDVWIDVTGDTLRRIRIEAGDRRLDRYVLAATAIELGESMSAR
jgi:hypothetical protein